MRSEHIYVILCVIVFGCSTHCPLTTIAKHPHCDSKIIAIIRQNQRANESPDFWRSIANDNRYSARVRTIAIMQLIYRHCKAGMTIEQFRSLIGQPTWLSKDMIHINYIGNAPVRWELGNSVASVDISISSNGNIAPRIYMAISGEIEHDKYAAYMTYETNDPVIGRYEIIDIASWECLDDGTIVINGWGIKR